MRIYDYKSIYGHSQIEYGLNTEDSDLIDAPKGESYILVSEDIRDFHTWA